MVALHSKVYEFESINSLTEGKDEESLIVKNALRKVASYKTQLKNFQKEVQESNSEDFKENSKSILRNWWDYELKVNKEKDTNKQLAIYKEANIAYPESFEILYNWGTTLLDLAKLNEDEKLFNESFEKYEQASILNPKNDSIFDNWGNDLSDLAKLNEDEKLFEEALEKLNIAIENGAMKYNLACLYSLKNKKEEALEILDKSLEDKEITKSFVLEDEDWKYYLEDEEFLNIINKYD